LFYNPLEIMALTIGTQLGSHEITGLLGKGGMGEVYRGRDLKLKREVAIKILPDEFSRNSDRVSRFQREAEVLASLNHPNIGAIYDLQEANDTTFLVLELVEGETLAERIQRGPIRVEEALEIGKHICEALEAAHEKGVIHRDLKPANVKITADGRVKVLDFGLAKAMSGANASPVGRSHQVMETAPASTTLSNSPTLTLGATQNGVILGTAAYMSPEQAKGLEVDPRSDMFSFGSVLYEMLTGRTAFQGDSVADVLASVLAREPDLTQLSPNLNPRLRELLERCFQKNPKRRWQAAGDLRIELEIAGKTPFVSTAATTPVTSPQLSFSKVVAALMMTATVVGALAAFTAWKLKLVTPGAVARFSIVLPDDQSFTRLRSQLEAISPDGKMIAYVANRQLYMRKLAELSPTPIRGTEGDVGTPFFSPDGQWLGFYSFRDSSIKKITVTGGSTVTLCAACAPTLAYGVSWENKTIVFCRGGLEILGIADTGGQPEVWVKAGNNELVSGPQVLPGGDVLMFSLNKVTGENWDKADIVTFSRKTKQRKVIIRGGSGARYVASGHILYMVGTTLWAVPFDLQNLKTTGDPVPVQDGVMRSTAGYGPADFDVSQTGTLMYVPSSSALAGEPGRRAIFIADRKGNANPVPGLPPMTYANPRVSPDGKNLAVELIDDGSIFVYDLSGKSQLRSLTFEHVNTQPVWSPDGRRIAYRSNRPGLLAVFVQNFDGTGAAERVMTSFAGLTLFAWSPDNKLVFGRDNLLWTAALTGEQKPAPLLKETAYAYSPSFSPSGRWVAYTSALALNRTHVFVQELPDGNKYQVSREPGQAPAWSPDGKELFYYQTDTSKLVAVHIQTQPFFSASEPSVLPIDLFQIGGRQYDMLPDGRFVIMRSVDTGARPTQQIQVVTNWFEELKQRVPVR
jgi:serine/threonine-protein kinase